MTANAFMGSKVKKKVCDVAVMRYTFYEADKAREKTLFHFFWGWACVWQKNESVFCAVA